jgi:hypothetical protein
VTGPHTTSRAKVRKQHWEGPQRLFPFFTRDSGTALSPPASPGTVISSVTSVSAQPLRHGSRKHEQKLMIDCCGHISFTDRPTVSRIRRVFRQPSNNLSNVGKWGRHPPGTVRFHTPRDKTPKRLYVCSCPDPRTIVTDVEPVNISFLATIWQKNGFSAEFFGSARERWPLPSRKFLICSYRTSLAPAISGTIV